MAVDFLSKDAQWCFFVFIVMSNTCHYNDSWKSRGKEEKMIIRLLFLILISQLVSLAFDSLKDIVNNNRFDDLYEFIVILANAKRMPFVRQSHPNKGRLG
jgi:hypothetical protein